MWRPAIEEHEQNWGHSEVKDLLVIGLRDALERYATVIPSYAVREGARKLADVRQAVGDDFDIAIDAHSYLTTVMAIDFCTRVEEFRPLWVEEPTQLEDLGELELLRLLSHI